MRIRDSARRKWIWVPRVSVPWRSSIVAPTRGGGQRMPPGTLRSRVLWTKSSRLEGVQRALRKFRAWYTRNANDESTTVSRESYETSRLSNLGEASAIGVKNCEIAATGKPPGILRSGARRVDSHTRPSFAIAERQSAGGMKLAPVR